ncbi:exodeoxyribonuclease III [Tropheryma whipplei]|uniref:Exodeoxyribonuclease III n=1 Tax=Tropheryma whipplei (strain Twist) TaxID=203267 RepID=Q83FI3_TROWT|nr:exodeoxyribonuclease III [Tropheryma whipplei]AAO44841.1 exodeoxyribonuclease III [Tropheryma whipplei str. Twist]MCO8182445.1 exodeoxyribonuclease III [Tropheryma whipplei]MCO8190289.1 exodeoxyribonuclease III [Tropheryma whipplei]CAD67415.1 exodeoxyribonuclease III [Tropheryma whipplei TW08/27]
MRIATWNVNSIKTRLSQVLHWLTENEIDILALQEIKCRTNAFPAEVFMEHGYFCAAHGLGGREGVAIVSKSEPQDITTDVEGIPGYDDRNTGKQDKSDVQARIIAATVGGVRLYSVYVPNGRDVHSPHYLYKLDWLEGFATHIRGVINTEPNLVIAGDFNIVLFDSDSNDPRVQTDTDVFRTPHERQAFYNLLDLGLRDLVRPTEPEGFTFWDYRAGRFQKNEGLRIDHILGTDPIANSVRFAKIHHEQRKGDEGKTPSDHVPVMIELR